MESHSFLTSSVVVDDFTLLATHQLPKLKRETAHAYMHALVAEVL